MPCLAFYQRCQKLRPQMTHTTWTAIRLRGQTASPLMVKILLPLHQWKVAPSQRDTRTHDGTAVEDDLKTLRCSHISAPLQVRGYNQDNHMM